LHREQIKTAPGVTPCVSRLARYGAVKCLFAAHRVFMKINKNEDNSSENKRDIEIPDLDNISIIDTIYQCGIIKFNIQNIINLLSDKIDKHKLENALNDSESPEYDAYQRGVAKGKFDLAYGLQKAAELGYNESYHALTVEQKRNAVEQKIKENFGL
jgi:hypothetical protein